MEWFDLLKGAKTSWIEVPAVFIQSVYGQSANCYIKLDKKPRLSLLSSDTFITQSTKKTFAPLR
jgi:hypothetical protein